jgi:DNA-directed RNA polymerase specialized sigma24 family protein
MGSGGEGSISRWIGPLKAGEAEAARELWRRYFTTLVRLARERLRGTRRVAADEEDVALSALDSFLAGAAAGRFPRLEDRDDLWRLLVTITTRKAADQVEHERRRKRGGGRVAGESALKGPGDDGPGLAQMVGPEPTPELAAMLAEECRRRLEGLRDETLRQVALLKMEGYTDREIAARLDCGLRTVVRKLTLIRKAWRGGLDR